VSTGPGSKSANKKLAGINPSRVTMEIAIADQGKLDFIDLNKNRIVFENVVLHRR